MTTRPSVKLDRGLLPGLVAVGLFAVMAYVFAYAPFTGRSGFPRGFPESESITENIGYLMFNLNDLATIGGEGFLVAFEVVDVVLVAALVAAVMLARRDEGGRMATALSSEPDDGPEPGAAETDGGRPRADGGEPAGEADDGADPEGSFPPESGGDDGGDR